ncbi:hypothetical protein JW933_01225, partial [candidate division FCPU426 bacterium]|nr:hypothetical protein [candidate division FCPU426 bacterium]
NSIITTSHTTGLTEQTIAESISKWGGLLSTTTTQFTYEGAAESSVTVSTYGPTDSQVSTTTIENDSFSGNKKYTNTTHGLGSNESFFDSRGVETKTVSHSELGVGNARHTTTDSILVDPGTGIKRITKSYNDMMVCNNFYDQDGLPATLYSERLNKFGPAEGRYNETVLAGGLWWNGNIRNTLTLTAIGATENKMDSNGFTTSSHSGNLYGANGSQESWATYVVNPATGMNISSRTDYCNGDYSTDQYDPNYGFSLESKMHNAEQKSDTTTKSRYYYDTGMTLYTERTGDDDYKEISEGYDNSRMMEARTQKKGKSSWSTLGGLLGSNLEKYWSTYEYNEWTGIKKKEVRTNISNSENKIIHYDVHGVESQRELWDWEFPDGEVYQVTEFTGRDGNRNPTGAIVRYGNIRTEIIHSFKTGVRNNIPYFWPISVTVLHHKALYITRQDITYTLSEDGPIAATVTDNQGSETWTMGGSYEQSDIASRNRVAQSRTMSWTYTDRPATPFHMRADISYANYLGIHNGSGTEEYTINGILRRQELNNTNTWNETITFSNDGNFITRGTGRREDGDNVTYSFTGANDIASMTDGKGVTTCDPSTHQYVSTTGGYGTFEYTYSNAKLEKIFGTPAKGGHAEFDQYWNLKTWKDNLGVLHTYTPLAKTKEYVTRATETFTDKNGTRWSGEVEYGPGGFYYVQGTLKAHKANIAQQGADNTVTLDIPTVLNAIRDYLRREYTERETGGEKRTLGEIMAENLTEDSLDMFGDVELTLKADGTASAVFKNITFKHANYYKKDEPEGDKWIWEGDGTESEEVYRGRIERNYTEIVAGPIGARRTPGGDGGGGGGGGGGGRGEGLGGGYRVGGEGGGPGVQGAAVEPGTLGEGGAKDGKVEAATTRQKTKLQKQFSKIRTRADARRFVAEVKEALGTEAIPAEVPAPDTVEFVKALIAAYRAVAGDDARQVELLAKLIVVLGSEPGLLAQVSEEQLGSEVLLALKIAQEIQDARDVVRDEAGNVVEYVDQQGARHALKYEAQGLTKTMTTAGGAIRIWHYDPAGRLLSENQGDTIRTLEYITNAQGKLEKIKVRERTENGTTLKEYDQQGLLLSVDNGSQVTLFDYTQSTNDTYIAKVYNNSGTLLEKQVYQNGRLVSKEDAKNNKSTYKYDLDKEGKVKAVTVTEIDMEGQKTVYQYDSAGRLVSAKRDGDPDFFAKMAQKEADGEKMLQFEMEKALFEDHRIDSMRIDIQELIGFE